MSATAGPQAPGDSAPRRAAERLVSAARRLGRAWGASGGDQRLAAGAALGLFVSMFLPWYSETIVFTNNSHVHHDSIRAFGSQFSFVEAAVLIVAAGVLAMLFARAERRAFHLPGGDGPVIFASGGWAALLIFYRLLDTPHTTRNAPRVITDVGLKWGIFFALAAAIVLAFAGWRVRAAHRPEPPLTSDEPPAAPGGAAAVETEPGTAATRPLAPTGPPTDRIRRPNERGRSGPGQASPTEQLSLDVPAAPGPSAEPSEPGPGPPAGPAPR